MSETKTRTRVIITGASMPGLPNHIKLRHDAGRGRWLVLAPERVFEPDDISVEILKRCDGNTSVEAIAGILAKEYNAPLQDILKDTISMLQELSDKGVVKA
jgi:pyrroloquinoline quinone biosynthesis protein D